MTKRLKQILVIFMAVFMFSCAAEEPAGGGWDPNTDEKPGELPVGDQGKFDTALTTVRDAATIDSATFSDRFTGVVESPKNIENSYLVTKMEGQYVVLFIHKEIIVNYHNINMGASTTLATAIEQASKNSFQDPRKILFKETFTDYRDAGKTTDRIRMTWTGRFGGGIKESGTDGTLFEDVAAYDNLEGKIHATGGRYGVGGVKDAYEIIYYANQMYEKDGNQISVRAANVARLDAVTPFASIINNGKNAWGWALRTPESDEVWSSSPNITLFGTPDESEGKKQFLYGTYNSTTAWDSKLTLASELDGGADVALFDTRNNFAPSGKAVLGRRDQYTGNTPALFLSPVVGYNIKTLSDDGTLLATLYPNNTQGSIKSAKYIYMEFDAASVVDAANDNTTKAGVEFPTFGDGGSSLPPVEGVDASLLPHNGVNNAGTKVQKFTGILLTL